jgi:hypothetical protein
LFGRYSCLGRVGQVNGLHIIHLLQLPVKLTRSARHIACAQLCVHIVLKQCHCCKLLTTPGLARLQWACLVIYEVDASNGTVLEGCNMCTRHDLNLPGARSKLHVLYFAKPCLFFAPRTPWRVLDMSRQGYADLGFNNKCHAHAPARRSVHIVVQPVSKSL